MDLEKENALLKAESCERDQLLARIAELESFVDLHYARIREG